MDPGSPTAQQHLAGPDNTSEIPWLVRRLARSAGCGCRRSGHARLRRYCSLGRPAREASADAEAVGRDLVVVLCAAGETCPLVAPPVLKIGCTACALGPTADRCPRCSAPDRSDAPHILCCNGLFRPGRGMLPRAGWPADARRRWELLCGVGVSAERCRLHALAIDVAWSAVAAGVSRRGSGPNASQGWVHSMVLRPVAALHTHDAFR